MKAVLFFVFSISFFGYSQNVEMWKNVNWGNIYYADREFNEAIVYYERSIALGEPSVEVYINLSRCYLKLKLEKQAIQAVEKSIQYGLPHFGFDLWLNNAKDCSLCLENSEKIFDVNHQVYLNSVNTDFVERLKGLSKRIRYTHDLTNKLYERRVDSSEQVESEIIQLVQIEIENGRFLESRTCYGNNVLNLILYLSSCIVNSEDPEKMFAYYKPFFERALKEDRIEPGMYAKFIDYFQVLVKGEGQRFGTLDWESYPFEDLDMLDYNRAQIGLPSINDYAYANRLRLPYGYKKGE